MGMRVQVAQHGEVHVYTVHEETQYLNKVEVAIVATKHKF